MKFNSLSFDYGINRMDFFTGIGCGFKVKNFEKVYINIQFQTGVIKSFFQTQIFPRVGLEIGYDFFSDSSRYKIIPITSYSFSCLNINQSTPQIHYWGELYVGYFFSYGRKLRFTQRTVVGKSVEYFKSQVDNHRIKASVSGYFLSFGLLYEI